MLKDILLALWLVGIAPLAAAQDDDIPWHNVELVMRGDLFRAAMIAYTDFSKLLAERAARLSGGERDEDVGPYLATINNYNFEVGRGAEIYVVWITPRSSRAVPGLFGGGARYSIDAKQFTVIEKQYSK